MYIHLSCAEVLCLHNKCSPWLCKLLYGCHVSSIQVITEELFCVWSVIIFVVCLSVFLSVSCQQNVSRGSTGLAVAWTARASTTAPATGSRAAAGAPRVTTATPVSTVSGGSPGALVPNSNGMGGASQ